MPTAEAIAHDIAKVIKDQIGIQTLWSFAATKHTAILETDTVRGGLRFNFQNCPKIKQGVCEVLLMPSDTYNVVIKTYHGTVKYEAKMIYADMLKDILIDQIG